jgi:hypothetical protein
MTAAPSACRCTTSPSEWCVCVGGGGGGVLPNLAK